MVYRLLLLRHAKAGWAAPGTSDFQRPLTKSGETDAQALGRRMTEARLVPDQILCSTAQRARATWDKLAAQLDRTKASPIFSDDLYNTDARCYVDTIRAAPICDTLLVVGHNPMMEDLALVLPGEADDKAQARVGAGFPTCGLAVLHFAENLTALKPGTGALQDFITPARR